MASTAQPEVRSRRFGLARFVSATAALALSAGLGMAAAVTPAQAIPAPEVSQNWLDYYYNNKGIGSDLPGDRPNLDDNKGFHRSNLITGGNAVSHPGGVKFGVEVPHPADATVKYRMSGEIVGPFNDNIEATGQRIDTQAALGSSAAEPATKIALVWTGHNANTISPAPQFTLRYSDNTTAVRSMPAVDWCSNGNSSNTMIATLQHRWGDTANCTIFISNIISIDAGKKLDAIDFPDDPRLHVFAIASDADTSNATTSFGANIQLPDSIAVGEILPAPSVQWIGEAPVATSTYWYLDGVAQDQFSTGAYVVPASWAGKSVAYAIIGRSPGYAPSSQISDEATVAAATLTTITDPSLAGLARVGDTLVANVGQYGSSSQSPTSVGTAIEWLQDGAVIPAAANEIFVPTATQIGKAISVRVTVTKPGHTTLVLTTSATAAVLAADANPFPDDPNQPGGPGQPNDPDPVVAIRAAASVSGTARVGATLSARAGSFEPATALVTYQWFRNTQAIPGATNSSYRLVPADARTVVSVRIQAGAPARQTTEQFLSIASVANGTIATKKPKVAIKKKAVKKKKVRVGTKLNVRGGKANAPGAKLKTKYQWFAGNSKIKGKKAKKAKFKVTKKLTGKRLSVKVTYNAKGYTKKTVSSVKTKKVVK